MTDNAQFFKDLSDNFANNSTDFGFTAVDAPETEVVTTTAAPTSQNLSTTSIKEVTDSVKTGLSVVESQVKILYDKFSAINTADLTKKTDIIKIEQKLDKMLDLQIQEFSSALGKSEGNIRSIIDEVEERKSELKSVYVQQMKALEALILPLLYNLMKNPTKEYIHWPNRTETINQQISKIISVTRTEMDI